VLAFLFRTFEAEAFVIPTGSMAPTLQGRHKDVACPECGYQYRVGAQGEREDRNPDLRMARAVCPMCRYELDLATLIPEDPRTYQTFEGDRILVNKFSYDLGEPKRFDVVVFKYPEDAKTNYIKRLIGLPGEHIYIGDPGDEFTLDRIRTVDGTLTPRSGTGDIYVSTDGGKTRRIARKERGDKLVAMLQDVYDNDYIAHNLVEAGWPLRWRNAGAATANKWDMESEGRTFTCSGEGNNEAWIRYHHLLPQGSTWDDAQTTNYTQSVIHDFYAYNTGEYHNHQVNHGQNWVGDLALECEADVSGDAGELVLELVKGGLKFQARLNLANGEARLVIPGLDDYKPTASDVIKAPGKHELRFANIDEQLWLFVDDEAVEFDAPTTYESLDNYMPITDPARSPVGASDLSPAGIASVGADVTVSHIRLKRDVFYTRGEQEDAIDEIELVSDDPADRAKDRFFMLGDNSPASKDGRMWGDVKWVERRLLIGKAVYIYWPHAVPASFSFEVPVLGSKKYIPFWPNFARMHRVR
jgi:signal peptidase I